MIDVDVPFDLVSGLIVVDCAVNGTSQRFVVDTGASNTIVTAKAADALGLVHDETERQTAQGAGGGIGAVPVTVRSFKWGDRELFDMTLIRVELDRVCGLVGDDIAGVIGADLLSANRLTVDYPEQRLILEPAPSS
ncbi:MAG: retropepsin-like aspartic protease [Gemmatimonadales bacterium]